MKMHVPFIYFLIYPFIHVSCAADPAGRDRISVIRRDYVVRTFSGYRAMA